MQSNPLYMSTIIVKEHLPIKICCVLDNFDDYNDVMIRMIRDYCNEHRIQFITRLYSSYKYSDDRYFIRSLPAFHIYIKKSYSDTFYPNMNPFQHITDSLDTYSKRTRKKSVMRYFKCAKS